MLPVFIIVIRRLIKHLRRLVTFCFQIFYCNFLNICIIINSPNLDSGYILYYLIYNSDLMCQCMLCECWWCNFCGVFCGGCAHHGLCYSYWCCKPQDFEQIDPNICHCCSFEGLGGNCCCYGDVMCAPFHLQQWSR